jgi:hypothetical protein
MPVEQRPSVSGARLACPRGWLRVVSDSLLVLSVLSLAVHLLRAAFRGRAVGAPAARAGELVARRTPAVELGS